MDLFFFLHAFRSRSRERARGGEGAHTAVSLDLGAPAPAELEGTFDVAFSHTVLEHIEDPVFAFNQIAKLTSDLIITVVPFKQKMHFEMLVINFL